MYRVLLVIQTVGTTDSFLAAKYHYLVPISCILALGTQSYVAYCLLCSDCSVKVIC